MSEIIFSYGLGFSVLWPLFLALPYVQTRFPGSLLPALLPAAFLLLWPVEAELSLPSVLFSSGLALDYGKRWMLGVTLLVWLIVANLKPASAISSNSARNTFLLLTLSGSIGAILSTDLAAFFSFTTLMGYAFYGLLVEKQDSASEGSGQRFLILLIIADLLLFEALLLASFSTDRLQFETVRHVMSGGDSAAIYLVITFLGFAFKAGAWPTQRWLLKVYQSRELSNTLLVSTVPVAIAMLGAVRWMPLGEQAFPLIGFIIQSSGLVTLLYVAFKLFYRFSPERLAGWITVAGSALFIVAIGYALVEPVFWQQYGDLSAPLIAAWVLMQASISLINHRLTSKQTRPEAIIESAPILLRLSAYLLDEIQHRVELCYRAFHFFQIRNLRLLSSRLTLLLEKTQTHNPLNGWSARVLLFTLLGMGMAWLAFSA